MVARLGYLKWFRWDSHFCFVLQDPPESTVLFIWFRPDGSPLNATASAPVPVSNTGQLLLWNHMKIFFRQDSLVWPQGFHSTTWCVVVSHEFSSFFGPDSMWWLTSAQQQRWSNSVEQLYLHKNALNKSKKPKKRTVLGPPPVRSLWESVGRVEVG